MILAQGALQLGIIHTMNQGTPLALAAAAEEGVPAAQRATHISLATRLRLEKENK